MTPFNSASCQVDLLHSMKYLEQMQGKNIIMIDIADINMVSGVLPKWLSIQNNCDIVSFDGHPTNKVEYKCGNCFLDKCEILRMPAKK